MVESIFRATNNFNERKGILMENPKAQLLQAKYVLDYENSELFHYYEEAEEKFVYCFFGDLEIDGDLRLDWEGYGDAGNFAEGFCERYNIRGGWLLGWYNPITIDGEEVENPVEKAGIVPGDTIHTVNGHKVFTSEGETDNEIIYAGSPKQVEVEYTHLGEPATTTIEPYYIDGLPRLGIQCYLLNEKKSPEDYGICVLGNLKVNGSVVNRTGEGGPMLYVKGDLEADNLIAGGAFVEVKGTTRVKHYVYGHYNDGIARLEDVEAKAVINSDHDLSFGEFTGLYLDDVFDVEEYFDSKYEDEIDAMLDGADIIMPEDND